MEGDGLFAGELWDEAPQAIPIEKKLASAEKDLHEHQLSKVDDTLLVVKLQCGLHDASCITRVGNCAEVIRVTRTWTGLRRSGEGCWPGARRRRRAFDTGVKVPLPLLRKIWPRPCRACCATLRYRRLSTCIRRRTATKHGRRKERF